ncbi:MAG: hypothetical protein WDA10_08840 [Porticoccaceae bacterium]
METDFKTLRARTYLGLRAQVREDERIFAIRRDRAGWFVGTVTTRQPREYITMSLDHKALSRRCYDEALRTEVLLHLGTMCQDAAFPSVAEEAFIDDWDGICAALGLDPDACDPEEPADIATLLHEEGKLGFLVQFATPVPRFRPCGDIDHHGWGMYSLTWIYAETLGEAFDKAFAWRRQYIQAQRERQQAAMVDPPKPDNPFMTSCYNGVWVGACSADDRIPRVREFTLEECSRALQLDDLQTTVRRALERRIRQLKAMEPT